MKQKVLIGVQIFFATVIIATGVTFAKQAGGSDDPLVAKSYVDDKINQVLEVINTTVGSNVGNKPTNTNVQISGNSFKPVLVEVGQTIYGKEGTELILRSGKGNAVVPGKEGIANITNGIELRNKNTVNKNHFLIIPRDDGRGVKVTEKAWFLVKGDYEIK
ncbi:hypothetical protein [uncultured Tyzzerella sp.]|uniref:hypothetical protein n=1 Tax=uncultured Tyzzerella sp. TaxID=2321398 RepID=UPI00294395AE|nr:hypothetical protein [uncultured Tyzzerella sp.]